MMNWNNVDLSLGGYQRYMKLIDPLSFDLLLLEVSCNIREINRETVTEQFETDLEQRIRDAKEIFAANLDSIVAQAKEEREMQ